MIERILDKYYMKKLVDKIKFTLLPYYLDFEYIFEEDRVLINCKKKKYKDYSPVIKIDYKYCFSYLCDYDNFVKRIKRLVDDYCKEEQE